MYDVLQVEKCNETMDDPNGNPAIRQITKNNTIFENDGDSDRQDYPVPRHRCLYYTVHNKERLRTETCDDITPILVCVKYGELLYIICY